MGKNAAHKQMQRSRHTGGGDGDAPGPAEVGDGLVDATFHTPAWHAMRIAALTTERMSWEDWKKKQKDVEAAEAAAAMGEEAQMREYRAQLDADRASRLAKGTNNAHLRDEAKASKKESKKRKRKEGEKDKARKKEKKRKDSGKGEKRKDREKPKKKKSKHKRSSSSVESSSDSGSSSSDGKPAIAAEADGPVRLSDFLRD